MHDNLIPFAKLDDWQLEHKRQDVRGWPIRDRQGQALGTVDEMLVDRDRERVAAVTLSDGSTVPIEQISICDDYVELQSAGVAASATGRTATTGDTVTEERIPIVEEQIKVGKRTVERGSVHVSTHIVEQPVHEQVRLRDETVEVERRPVEHGEFKPEYAPDLLSEREVEMHEVDEVAVVAKEAVVKEELIVRKQATERVENIEETVRRTDVEVDKLGGGSR